MKIHGFQILLIVDLSEVISLVSERKKVLQHTVFVQLSGVALYVPVFAWIFLPLTFGLDGEGAEVASVKQVQTNTYRLEHVETMSILWDDSLLIEFI